MAIRAERNKKRFMANSVLGVGKINRGTFFFYSATFFSDLETLIIKK